MKNPFIVNNVLNLRLLLILLLIPQVVGWIGAALSANTAQIYSNLNQPDFAPPSWIFAPVWTVLYLLMGIASYRIVMLFIQGNSAALIPFKLYLVQLFFNFIWTLIFFRWGLRGLAFLDIIILLTLIIITTILFYKRDKTAGYLMIPYIAWVIFAGALNYSVWQLN